MIQMTIETRDERLAHDVFDARRILRADVLRGRCDLPAWLNGGEPVARCVASVSESPAQRARRIGGYAR